MNRLSMAVLICLLFAAVANGETMEGGTSLLLGAGQELRMDVPLEAGKAYTIKLEFGTYLQDAELIVILAAVGPGGQAAEYQSVRFTAAESGSWQQIVLETGEIAPGPLRWELVLQAEPEGRYFWRNLSVARVSQAQAAGRQKWSEKIAREGTFYTGLVVDARHLDVQRGISPRIYSESGLLLYGGVLASQDLVQERGIVAYGSELTPELLDRLEVDADYSYTAPLIVQATGVAGPTKTGVYVSDEDAERILTAMVQYDFFARYAVVFLVK